MKRMCRELLTPWRRQGVNWKELFPHARIVTDERKLAQLNAAVEQRKQKERLLELVRDTDPRNDREVFPARGIRD
jgi:hypothetical protein